MKRSGLTVSEVARIVRLTVRTLHHYDEIGLLTPSGRSAAGYRLYSDDDLSRLHQIVVFRELGFSLEAIAQLVEETPEARCRALRDQRERLVLEQDRAAAVIRALDSVLATLEGAHMTTEEKFSMFGDFDPARYDDEVRDRWGKTDSYAESKRRTGSYGKAEWGAISAESGANLATFAALLAAGTPPEDVAAMDAAEQARLHIDRWFYPCSHEMHAQLAEGYVSDERFTAFYERIAVGMAAYVAAAIRANSARAGG